MPSDNQLWVFWPIQKKIEGYGEFSGWNIVPYVFESEGVGDQLSLVVVVPPEGDGRPYIDTSEFVGFGDVWQLEPVQ
jgi:hypothetical protein